MAKWISAAPCYSALLLAAVAMPGCSKSAQSAGSDPSPALRVKVQTATPEPVGQFTDYLATLQSRSAAVLQPQVEGQITRIFVRSGDQVEAGAALLEIDPLKQEAALRTQEANRRSKLAALEYNRTELQRRKKLFAAGVISKQELDQAQSAYDSSKADVEALNASVREQQEQLRYYTVRAPAAGIIGDIPVRVGDRVKVDTVLTTLDRGGKLEAYISVPAEKSSVVRLGMPVEVLDDNGQAAVHTQVTFISPRVDASNQLLLIKAAVPNPARRFRNDQVVHARVIWTEHKLPVVPVTAVSRVGGQMFAFVAETSGSQTVARQRTIQVGDVVGNNYVILGGIKAGDRIIISGVQVLADGMPVTPEVAATGGKPDVR